MIERFFGSADSRWWLIGAIVLAILVAGVFSPLSLDYAFYYSDAPRHALNGAFILDLVRDFPIHDPVQWAYDYYAQYPSLTILFYPPLYPAVLAVFYALFGVSQATATLANAMFFWLLAIGTARLARYYVTTGPALAAGALVAVSPVLVFWARQSMTDVPATAMAVWSFVCLAHYLRADRARWLFAAVVLFLAALWIKLTVCFLAAAFALAIVAAERGRIWRRSRNWWAAAVAIIGILPLVWLTLRFGQTNVGSVTSVPDAATARLSLANWLWYARQLPQQLGWPFALVAAVGLVVALVNSVRARRLTARGVLLATWLVVGYLFFSAIDLKSPRFTLPILPPLAIVTAMLAARLSRYGKRAAYAGLLLLIAATLIITWVWRPPLQVVGYEHIVRDVAREAPKNSNVVFSGYRDGAFVFAMRAIGNRPDLNVVRADKLLLNVAIRRAAGVEQKGLSKKQIADQLTRIKAAYVVSQDGFWDDLAQMRRFEAVLHSDQFEPVAHYRLRANYPATDREITVYRNLAHLPAKRPTLSINLPAIGTKISGE